MQNSNTNNKISDNDKLNDNILPQSDTRNLDEKRKIIPLMFERLLNNKNKFSLDNHFDENNSHQFLLDKEKYLTEIKLDDGKLKSSDTCISKKELIIPNGAPNKYTFGQ